MREPRYIEIPGNGTHELPPLLLHSTLDFEHGDGPIDLSSILPEAEDMLPPSDAAEGVLEQRKLDLAVELTERYKAMLSHWQWGDSVLEWIRQCEITFESVNTLRRLLHPDVWPHASRASFVTLLMDKHVPTQGVPLEKAVGLRLIFREPSPIRCLSNQFLLYLNSTIADSAYRTWSRMTPDDPVVFPPDRFHFEVVVIDN